MKNLKKMINEIDIETIEKVINILSGLKVFKKYNCETCKHEISSICLDCDIKNKSKGWEPKEEEIDCQICRFSLHECGVCPYEKKEPEKSIEKQIFELIKDNVFVDLNLNVLNFEMFQEMYTENSGYSILFRNYLFLAIMKSVHQLIENENFRLKWDTEYYTFRNDDLKNTFAVCIINVKKIMVKNNKTQHPDYFYFSSEKNAEKAINILSNFFGINILDWWYK